MLLKYMTICLAFSMIINCLPHDDGKYRPKKINGVDEGKYYRPPHEGKYIPGDEGKYTYIYRQWLHQFDNRDYSYKHQIGPDGGFGGNGKDDNRDYGHGDYDPSTSGTEDRYISNKVYAERFPYKHKVIDTLLNKYVSTDSLLGEASAMNRFEEEINDPDLALKCQYLLARAENSNEFRKEEEIVTEYISPTTTESSIKEDIYKIINNEPHIGTFSQEELIPSLYKFEGTNYVNQTQGDSQKRLKLDYEVVVRVTEIGDE